jgi:RecB family exonuclease
MLTPDYSNDSTPELSKCEFGKGFEGKNLTRSRNLYTPEKEFSLSRSKLELFLKCPCCFYRDRRQGVSQIAPFPYSLNSAVDELLKKEFDYYREQGLPHPLMQKANIPAIPFSHPKMDDWRDSLHRGVQAKVPGTNFKFSGGVDDIWINSAGKLHVVDYKSTASKKQVSLDDDYKDGYKRQVEMYQWLLRANGFEVSDTAYFVYCNADTGRDSFDEQLVFNVNILAYEGDSGWVERALSDAYSCLNKSKAPAPKINCDHCKFLAAAELVNRANRKG